MASKKKKKHNHKPKKQMQVKQNKTSQNFIKKYLDDVIFCVPNCLIILKLFAMCH